MSYINQLLSAQWANSVWFLGLVPAFLILSWFVIRGKEKLLPALIRFSVIALVLGALASPEKRDEQSSEQLTVLMDSSYSVGDRGLEHFSELLEPYMDGRDGLKLSVLPFGKGISSSSIPINSVSDLKNLPSNAAESVNTGGSDLAEALTKGASRSTSQSLLLLTDGIETIGNAREAAEKLTANLFPLVPNESIFTTNELSLASLDAPLTSSAGEKVNLLTSVKNPFSTERIAAIEIWLDNKKLSSTSLVVPAREEKVFSLKTPKLEPGLKRIRAVLVEEGKSLSEKHRWLSIKDKAKTLLISGSKDDQAVIKKLYSIQGITVEAITANGRSKIPTDFSKHSTIILNNVAKRQLPGGFLGKLKEFVKNGGGLLLIGGDRSFGLGGYIKTPLEEISPVSFVPPTTKKKRLINAVALVIDKSRSMQKQGRIQSAKLAALSSINSLKDDDMISVIGFDSAPFKIIGMKTVREAKPNAERRLRNLTAAGRTRGSNALGLARRLLQNSGAGRLHVIVLSDGEFEDAPAALGEISRLKKEGISVSSVALGSEADVPFMREIASIGTGAFYHTLDASKLPQIFLKDIKVAVGEETLQEQKDFGVRKGPDGIVSTSTSGYPVLRGIVETKNKSRATKELISYKRDKAIPVLSSWNYGKGKVIAFTSDANGRWSNRWLAWGGFGKFWKDLLVSIRPDRGKNKKDIDYDLRYKIEGSSLALDLSVFDPDLASSSAPVITVDTKEPGGETSKITLNQSKKGRFYGKIKGARPGDYKININYGGLSLPPAGITVPGDAFGEKQGQGLNVSLLGDLAHISGGSINPDPGSLSLARKTTESKQLLFIPLIILAFILLLVEAFVREFFGQSGRTKPGAANADMKQEAKRRKKAA